MNVPHLYDMLFPKIDPNKTIETLTVSKEEGRYAIDVCDKTSTARTTERIYIDVLDKEHVERGFSFESKLNTGNLCEFTDGDIQPFSRGVITTKVYDEEKTLIRIYIDRLNLGTNSKVTNCMTINF